MNKNTWREIRKYVYGVAIAAVPFAVHYGWIEPEASVVILPLLMALLNLTPKEVAQEVYNEDEFSEYDLSDDLTDAADFAGAAEFTEHDLSEVELDDERAAELGLGKHGRIE